MTTDGIFYLGLALGAVGVLCMFVALCAVVVGGRSERDWIEEYGIEWDEDRQEWRDG